MLNLLKIWLLLWFIPLDVEAGDLPTLSEGEKTYTNFDGIHIALVPLKPLGANSKVILYITGSHSSLDGYSMITQRKEKAGQAQYVREISRAKPRYVLSAGVHGAESQYRLYLPQRAEGIAVYYNEAASRQIDKNKLYQMAYHLRAQVRDPGGHPRSEMEKIDNETFQKSLSATNEMCSSALKASIAWKTFSDPVVKGHNVGSACSEFLSGLQKVCEDPTGTAKKVVKEKLKAIECRSGSKLDLKTEGTTAIWVIPNETPNLRDFAEDWLEENL